LKHDEVGQGNRFSPAIPGKLPLTGCTAHTCEKYAIHFFSLEESGEAETMLQVMELTEKQ
jgi:hypothetical protein